MARTGTQAAHAHLHGIECVERLGLNPLMRALVWLLEWLPAKTAEWLNMDASRQICILHPVCRRAPPSACAPRGALLRTLGVKGRSIYWDVSSAIQPF